MADRTKSNTPAENRISFIPAHRRGYPGQVPHESKPIPLTWSPGQPAERPPSEIEAPCTKVPGIFQARKGFICCSSLANPRSKLRGMRSLFLFKNDEKEVKNNGLQGL